MLSPRTPPVSMGFLSLASHFLGPVHNIQTTDAGQMLVSWVGRDANCALLIYDYIFDEFSASC